MMELMFILRRYDMYAGDSRGTSAAVPDGMVAGTSQQGEALPEPGQALEVIELANGETIWSVLSRSFLMFVRSLTRAATNQVHCQRTPR